MKRIMLIAAAIMLLARASWAQDPEFIGQSCTSIMVGRLASNDGSVMTSHTCDGRYRTWAYMEPAADHKKGEMHDVFKGTMHTAFRGDTTGVKLAGQIPEAKHTYSYLNTAYPCMNEKQLAIGETTFSGPDTLINRNGMFMIEELERVALQRCDNARDAIKLMGSLAEKYGYGDGGECLTVADPKEVWQFEIMGAGKDKIGAIWAALRIPDGEVGISANISRLTKINRKDKDNCLASDNIEEVAKANGLWDGNGEFVWWRAFVTGYGGGHNYSDREWFIFNELAPSLGLKSGQDELPFSIKPEKPVDLETVMALFRATYEGTDSDPCKNVLIDSAKISPIANPWVTTSMKNTINHLAPGTIASHRTVAVAWCAYSTVIQLHADMPDNVGGICWLALDNPAQSPRIPIFCGNTTIPEGYWTCGQKTFNPQVALWQWRKANKLATLSWQTTKKGFNEKLIDFQSNAISAARALQKGATTSQINDCTQNLYEQSVKTWADMESEYWVKFGLGF